MAYLSGQQGVEKAKSLAGFYEDLYKISELGGLIGNRPVSALTTNLFLMQVDRVESPFLGVAPIRQPIDILTVQRISGVKVSVSTLTRADGQSGRVFNYNAGAISFNEITITAVRDITYEYDYLFHNLVYAFSRNGVKIDGTLRKFQFATNAELYQYRFKGMSFYKIEEPALDKAGEGLYEFTISAKVDMWYERPVPGS
ncbi:MAG: hypothetical protein RML35_00810 [Chloroherpetonaceae bacterium]|nr:hypothetical protein [Chloroherpetonaceae bacterium]